MPKLGFRLEYINTRDLDKGLGDIVELGAGVGLPAHNSKGHRVSVKVMGSEGRQTKPPNCGYA